MKSRRVHRRRLHKKTRKGGFLNKIAQGAKSVKNSLTNYINNPQHYSGPEESEYEKQLKAERESVAELPLVAPPRGGRRTRHRKRSSHRRR